MFTFRRLTLLFFMILLGLNLWNIFHGRSEGALLFGHATLVYVSLFCLYFGLSFIFAFFPCSNFHHPVICSGKTDEKSVAITFDDGPHAVFTPVILDILHKYGVKAMFFCIGKNIRGNESLIRQIHQQGHLIGNHSFSHSKWFDLFSPRRIRAELVETDLQISNITGNKPGFFRPPYGVVNPMVSRALKTMHWKTVCWSIRSFDTLEREPRKISEKVLRQLKPGAIILLHDFTSFSQHHLEELLIAIQSAGYTIVPVDHLLNTEGYV